MPVFEEVIPSVNLEGYRYPGWVTAQASQVMQVGGGGCVQGDAGDGTVK